MISVKTLQFTQDFSCLMFFNVFISFKDFLNAPNKKYRLRNPSTQPQPNIYFFSSNRVFRSGW